MACDSTTLEALISADQLTQLSERDRLVCLAYVYGQRAGHTATTALALAYSTGLPKLSDRDLDTALLSTIC